MNFVWWLVKRAWQLIQSYIVEWWNKPETSVSFSGKQEISSCLIVVVWLFTALVGSTLYAITENLLYFVVGLLSFVPMIMLLFVSEIKKWALNLYAQYHSEAGNDEKPKRKRKHGDYRDARGCLSELFEDDPRPSEQIVRDYRDDNEYCEPFPPTEPLDNLGSILDYFNANVEYFDKHQDESDGE